MEADWSVAAAGGDPVIVVPWAASVEEPRALKFIDLRLHPERVDELEAAHNTPLRSALLLLNGGTSHLWTAKCDFWTSSTEPFDPYEMDATPAETAFGVGSYIDLLPRHVGGRTSFRQQEQWMRRVTKRLRGAPAKAARVELVLRAAQVHGEPGFGISWFVVGCGGSAESARQSWENVLSIALTLVLDTAFDPAPADDTMAETGE
jgi:hypothetical protein